ncbi:MAG: tRNA (guanosine(46)-N7)-methyltransferase TrmB [Clostridia bacterium]|nr:tRNA (guanosine(46)-N7)-methyltransferase TrmB [Clostridia bacterium]
MRMRKKKHGAERIEACAELLIRDVASLKEGFGGLFDKDRPVHLEIGCGKGNFAVGMAKKYPEVNLIAMEKVPDVCCIALEKAMASKEERQNDNLRFLIGDARTLEENVLPHSLDCIYLNFSDPWPKSGHAKRRLTHRSFLEIYKKLLKPGGLLRFKTDNAGLFDFSLEEFEAFGARVIWQTRNLHATEKNADNVMTEYEKNFSDRGTPICSAWVTFSAEGEN